jgi:hypothetical protein
LARLFHVFHLALEEASIRVLDFAVFEVSVFEYPFECALLLLPSSLAVWFVIFELAFVYVSIGVLEDAVFGHAVVKDSFKDTTIRVPHDTFSMMPALIVTFALIKGFSLM